MENRNKLIESDGLFWESETHEWFHDKISTDYAQTPSGLNDDALKNISCFIVRNKNPNTYPTIVLS